MVPEAFPPKLPCWRAEGFSAVQGTGVSLFSKRLTLKAW